MEIDGSPTTQTAQPLSENGADLEADLRDAGGAPADTTPAADQGPRDAVGDADKCGECLAWDSRHFANEEAAYCYCGGDRKLGEVALRCSFCSQWFHGRCVSVPEAAAMCPMQRNYAFVCAKCNDSGEEHFELRENSWRSMTETCIFNLMLDERGEAFRAPGEGEDILRFSIKDEIIPWLEARFDSLGHGREVAKMKEGLAIDKCVFNTNVSDTFSTSPERTHVGLHDPMALDVRPLQPAAGGPTPSEGAEGAKRKSNAADRAPKRKRTTVGAAPRRQDRARDRSQPTVQLQVQNLPERHRMLPVVRCTDMSNVAQDPAVVQLSCTHKASQLKLSRPVGGGDSYLRATGYKGYRTVCATHACGQGAWYYEVEMTAGVGGEGPYAGHCRLGWATELATPDAPVGFDANSYSYRSKHGTVFHEGRGKRYGAGYATGDVIGCLIWLPQASAMPRQRPRMTVKNAQYLIEDLDQVRVANEGSSICFFKNGEFQGVAFRDVAAEWYYPAVSLFMDSEVTVNFGPEFKKKPASFPDGIANVRPMCEAADHSDGAFEGNDDDASKQETA